MYPVGVVVRNFMRNLHTSRTGTGNIAPQSAITRTLERENGLSASGVLKIFIAHQNILTRQKARSISATNRVKQYGGIKNLVAGGTPTGNMGEGRIET